MISNSFSAPLEKLPFIELTGDSFSMGCQFGESCRQQIHELYEIRLKQALRHAAERGRHFSFEQTLQLAQQHQKFIEDYDPETFKELKGIGHGSNISLAQLFIMQGLTDFRDYLSWGKVSEGFGCTSLIVNRQRSTTGELILAQNWDLQTSNMPYVCMVHRRPNNGPQTLSLTVTGGLSMVTLNSEGLAVGTNNIKTTDCRPGVHYLNIIHKVSRQRNAEDACKVISDSPRAGAHYYLLGDKNGNSAGIECSATLARNLQETDGVITHCNHILHPEIKKLEAEDMGPSTHFRQTRVDRLTHDGQFDLLRLKQILSDHEGEDTAICRHDVSESISTNACIIIEPEKGNIHACRSQAHLGQWNTFSF